MSKIPDEKHEYRPGDHKIVCERSGRVIWASEARQEWNGRWVHKDWWEPKHPSLIRRKIPVDRIVAPEPIRSNDGVTACDQFWEPGVFQIGVMVQCID